MVDKRNEYAPALDMLLLESSSLKDLAQLSGLDPFRFYQGSNLTSLDLSDQDMTGLNFDFANLGGCCLDRVLVDAGALNRASIDSQYSGLLDSFDLAIDDLLIPEVGALSLNFRVRPDTLEQLVSSRGMYIRDFAAASDLTAASFWRMRNGYFVTFSTINKLLSFVRRDWKMFIHSDEEEHLLRQPCLQAMMSHGEPVDAKRILRAADIVQSWGLNPQPLHKEHNSRKISVLTTELGLNHLW